MKEKDILNCYYLYFELAFEVYNVKIVIANIMKRDILDETLFI